MPTKLGSAEDQARHDRAAERGKRMTVEVFALGAEPAPVLEGSSEERIDLLVELTRAAWGFSGKPWPQLPRSQWPVVTRKLGEEE